MPPVKAVFCQCVSTVTHRSRLLQEFVSLILDSVFFSGLLKPTNSLQHCTETEDPNVLGPPDKAKAQSFVNGSVAIS